MGLLGQKNRKAQPQKPVGTAKKAPSAAKVKGDHIFQGYDLRGELPEDTPLHVKLAQVMYKDPKKLKRLFVSWAESEEGDVCDA